jgi:hypothetical protein
VVLLDKFVPNADFSHCFLVVLPKKNLRSSLKDARLEYQNSWDGSLNDVQSGKGRAGAEGGKRTSTLGPCFADFTPASHALLTEAHRGVPTEGGGSRPAWKSASW